MGSNILYLTKKKKRSYYYNKAFVLRHMRRKVGDFLKSASDSIASKFRMKKHRCLAHLREVLSLKTF